MSSRTLSSSKSKKYDGDFDDAVDASKTKAYGLFKYFDSPPLTPLKYEPVLSWKRRARSEPVGAPPIRNKRPTRWPRQPATKAVQNLQASLRAIERWDPIAIDYKSEQQFRREVERHALESVKRAMLEHPLQYANQDMWVYTGYGGKSDVCSPTCITATWTESP